jgi:hypothetical protein
LLPAFFKVVVASTVFFCAASSDINPEALLAHTYETLCSASILTLDLSDDLEGKQCNLALAIYSLMELGLLLIKKLLDRPPPLFPLCRRSTVYTFKAAS